MVAVHLVRVDRIERLQRRRCSVLAVLLHADESGGVRVEGSMARSAAAPAALKPSTEASCLTTQRAAVGGGVQFYEYCEGRGV